METGFVLDRLSHRQREQWRSIERLVHAAGRSGAPLFPTLRGLWEWAAHGGPAIYIELSSADCAAKSLAGKFVLAGLEPHGTPLVGVIRLCLANIDRSPARGRRTHANGFVPFAGLGRKERYAEVLGHELAHAASDFASPERARTIGERVDGVSAQFVSHRAAHGNEVVDPALRQRIEERDALLVDLEAQADAIEWLVWRELARR
jgi:hypothetical protein